MKSDPAYDLLTAALRLAGYSLSALRSHPPSCRVYKDSVLVGHAKASPARYEAVRGPIPRVDRAVELQAALAGVLKTLPDPYPLPGEQGTEAVSPTQPEAAKQRAEALVESWNAQHGVGSPVVYWTGVREGEGKRSKTRTQAHVIGGHTAVVWLEGVSGCIALSHVEAA